MAARKGRGGRVGTEPIVMRKQLLVMSYTYACTIPASVACGLRVTATSGPTKTRTFVVTNDAVTLQPAAGAEDAGPATEPSFDVRVTDQAKRNR